MSESNIQGWVFTDEEGTFHLPNPHRYNSLYFPLVNEAGIFSAITPSLHGDIKADQHTFLTPPVSIERPARFPFDSEFLDPSGGEYPMVCDRQ